MKLSHTLYFSIQDSVEELSCLDGAPAQTPAEQYTNNQSTSSTLCSPEDHVTTLKPVVCLMLWLIRVYYNYSL